jgi:hypothetical protein
MSFQETLAKARDWSAQQPAVGNTVLHSVYGVCTVVEAKRYHGDFLITIRDKWGDTHAEMWASLSPCLPDAALKVGEFVTHDLFGAGQVVSTDGGLASIEFSAGRKRLAMNMVRRAPAPTIKAAPPAPKLKASPFVLRDPSLIPLRQFLYADHYARRYLTATVGAGGGGKSSNSIPEVLAMVTGQHLLGVTPLERLRVWYINLEDPGDEIERRFAAAILHYDLNADDIGDRLFTDSGRDQEVVIAKQLGREVVVLEPVVAAIVAELKARQIDVLVIDPFISSHQVPENDNSAIQVVAAQWARVADEANCSVELIHHVRKQVEGHEMTADDARGGGALKDKTRSMRVINSMSKDQADSAGIEPGDRDLYFRVDSGKSNMSRKGGSSWRKFVSVRLPNGGPGNLLFGDNIGVVTAWEWPSREDVIQSIASADLEEIKRRLAVGNYRENAQAKDWAGYLIAEVLALPTDTSTARKTLTRMLQSWIASGDFLVVEREDSARKLRPCIAPNFAAPPAED